MEKNKELSVLIVDNILISNLLLNNLISSIGHKVDSVFGCWQALSQIEQYEYDYILMKVGTPGLDGLVTTKVLQKHLNTTNNAVTRIIGMGHTDLDIKDSCIDSGMKEVIPCPIDFERLLTIIPDISYQIDN